LPGEYPFSDALSGDLTPPKDFLCSLALDKKSGGSCTGNHSYTCFVRFLHLFFHDEKQSRLNDVIPLQAVWYSLNDRRVKKHCMGDNQYK